MTGRGIWLGSIWSGFTVSQYFNFPPQQSIVKLSVAVFTAVIDIFTTKTYFWVHWVKIHTSQGNQKACKGATSPNSPCYPFAAATVVCTWAQTVIYSNTSNFSWIGLGFLEPQGAENDLPPLTCQEEKQTGYKEVFLFRKSCTEIEQIVPGDCRSEDCKWFQASIGQKEKNRDGLLHSWTSCPSSHTGHIIFWMTSFRTLVWPHQTCAWA